MENMHECSGYAEHNNTYSTGVEELSLNQLAHAFVCVQEHGPAGEDVGQHVLGDLGAAHAQSVAGILHLGQALAECVQLLGHLVGPRVTDEGEAVVYLAQEAAQLEGRVHVAVAHTGDAHAHQLARQVGHAQKVVGGGHLEGQDSRVLAWGHDLVTLLEKIGMRVDNFTLCLHKTDNTYWEH